MIKVCGLSDMHGRIPEIKEWFDLMLIAGDTVDLYSQRSKISSWSWYIGVFVDWVNSLSFKDNDSKVILIAGNHDLGLEALTDEEIIQFKNTLNERTNGRVIYLFHEEYVFTKGNESIKIFGTPYCKIFGRWAFMRTQEQLKELFSKIPENCDILLTHDAPYGTSDICLQWATQGRELINIGCEALRDAILGKKPRYVLHGHLHSANHNWEKLGNSKVVNVSVLDENYSMTYKPLYFYYNEISD